ncbi:hypothetical protein CaLGV095 [Clostera anastomosis granulovirus A]|uniref:Uncharacterized protein n=1 Tax=Clostera anastomosis granulovirus A TaxID=1986289 RepID=U5KBM7_9BBAC|nr:hypothetical protein CaLGV095 [Clostera anastomosis granulovirus Henan]AGQ20353.1 hypothetical protein CaLGV095 [Clostera anastomosis granulovirus Henan]
MTKHVSQRIYMFIYDGTFDADDPEKVIRERVRKIYRESHKDVSSEEDTTDYSTDTSKEDSSSSEDEEVNES